MDDQGGQKETIYTLEKTKLSPTQKSNASDSAQAETSEVPEAKVSVEPSKVSPIAQGEHLFLGELEKTSKLSRQLAITRCLNSVSGGSRKPWKAYPGHSKLMTLDIDLNGTRKSRQYHAAHRLNSGIKDWLIWGLRPPSDGEKRSKKANLKLLLVTVNSGEKDLETANEDAETLKSVFDEWDFPTAALSVLLDRRATCMDQHVITNPIGKPSGKNEIRVYFIGMRQWSMVWSTNPLDEQFRPRGVIMCLDKTWASSVPGVVLQYFKTMWMFLDYQGIFPLIACMASLRYASSALAEDDKEAVQREYELRSWLKTGSTTEKKNLGYTSAQVSWLSSRVSRHRDRLMVVNRMLAILKDTLDIYEIYAQNNSFEIIRTCICNLADMKEHLRAQARQLEAQANVQLAALFNLITQKDSAAAMMIAKTSQSIAADSRRDQKVSVDIANSSRIIAFNTLRDSASTKAIANVTMVFLPGTFLASVFAMPFFSPQKATGFFVNSKVWIYVAFTVPLTVATLLFAWAWRHISRKSHRVLHVVGAEETGFPFVGEAKDEGQSWTNAVPFRQDMLSPTEKDIERGPYTPEEEVFEMDLEQHSQDENDIEHWDPMTREFAPSIFAASSFVFTEDSDPASPAEESASISQKAASKKVVGADKKSRQQGHNMIESVTPPATTGEKKRGFFEKDLTLKNNARDRKPEDTQAARQEYRRPGRVKPIKMRERRAFVDDYSESDSMKFRPGSTADVPKRFGHTYHTATQRSPSVQEEARRSHFSPPDMYYVEYAGESVGRTRRQPSPSEVYNSPSRVPAIRRSETMPSSPVRTPITTKKASNLKHGEDRGRDEYGPSRNRSGSGDSFRSYGR